MFLYNTGDFRKAKTDWQKLTFHVMFASRIFTKVSPKILFTSYEHSHHKAKQQSSCVSHTPAQMEAVYLLSSLIKIADSFIPTATDSAELAMDNFTTVWSRYTLSRSSDIRNSWYLICRYHYAVATIITNRFEESWEQIVLPSSQHWLTTSHIIL